MYPYHKELQGVADKFDKGNFALWHNKLVPLSNNHKPCDKSGDDKKAVAYYVETYQKLSGNEFVVKHLNNKHTDQYSLCKTFAHTDVYMPCVFTAELISPLVLGIGESHPHEISMLFDHTMGIPYIPASSLKGVVRLAHTIGLIGQAGVEIKQDKKGREYIDDECCETLIAFFGTQARKGRVIFFDAYPVAVPVLKEDIINPHYPDYYREGQEPKPPTDNQNPNPVKFMAVAKGTKFVFRFLIHKDAIEHLAILKSAVKKSLTEDGIGAKTAIGYGLFKIVHEAEPPEALKVFEDERQKKEKEAGKEKQRMEKEASDKKRASMTLDDLMIEEINGLVNDTNMIVPLVKRCLDGKDKYEREVFVCLKQRLETLEQWKPDGSKQKKEKMRERNNAIELLIK
ncbi:MAG: type III-B CRISPR module RAMP protein Cmr6 [Deltaproteobacteria bacterium]|nr:type III-B CRISPR module RAMP protein Cmr6 [Deltaproteobacteria bacterium]